MNEIPSSELTQSKPERVRIGEELPIFCEECGYALHGMPQIRCEHCAILQFHCPECGHHQPINTLRPAAQRILARLRAFGILAIALATLVFFGITLLIWTAMGSAWSHNYSYQSLPNSGGYSVSYSVHDLTEDMVMAFLLYGFGFGLVARMLLLRWRRGFAIGLVLAVLIVAAVSLGAWIELHNRNEMTVVISNALMIAMAIAAVSVIAASSIAWPLWKMLVFVLVPRRMGAALLKWQESLSDAKEVAVNDRATVELSR